jgi:hypothetical protein
MLHDLTFLGMGKQWPPPSENERLNMYAKNRMLFECDHVHTSVYQEQLKRIARVVGNFQDIIDYPVILNFQKLTSLKVADLLFGESPKINAGEPGPNGSKSIEQKAIDKIEEMSGLDNTCYEAAIDVSRYGDGLLYVRKNENGAGIIDVTQPPIWFPVVDPANVRRVLYHVLAWVYTEPTSTGDVYYLKAEIHKKGENERRTYLLEKTITGYTIKKPIGPVIIETTGIDDFDIIQISNVKASGQATGLDDYTDIDSIVSELVVRIGQIARILDKHADPSMQGPKQALTKDPKTGEWQLLMHNYFAKESKEDADVSYLVWDGELSAAFEQIEKLTNYLYTFSEMGAALLGDMGVKTGQVPSGSALRRLMMSPLAKVGRIRMRFDPALKRALRLCSKIGGEGIVDLTDADISIQWQDGLPQDETEIANVSSIRVSSGTMSRHRAITLYDGLSDEDADEELARIMDEEATMGTALNNSPQVSESTQPNNRISGTV